MWLVVAPHLIGKDLLTALQQNRSDNPSSQIFLDTAQQPWIDSAKKLIKTGARIGLAHA